MSKYIICILIFFFYTKNRAGQMPANATDTIGLKPLVRTNSAPRFKHISLSLYMLENFNPQKLNMLQTVADSCRGKCISKVIMSISEKGQVTEVSLSKKIHPEIDAEIKRIFQEMQGWTPAMKDGEPIDTVISFPIRLSY